MEKLSCSFRGSCVLLFLFPFSAGIFCWAQLEQHNLWPSQTVQICPGLAHRKMEMGAGLWFHCIFLVGTSYFPNCQRSGQISISNKKSDKRWHIMQLKRWDIIATFKMSNLCCHPLSRENFLHATLLSSLLDHRNINSSSSTVKRAVGFVAVKNGLVFGIAAFKSQIKC